MNEALSLDLTLEDQLYDRVRSFKKGCPAVKASRAIVEKKLGDGNAYYGINTGFGILARNRISDEQVATLQYNLLLSHAVGLGDPVPPEITRLMLLLKIHALSLGYSGISAPVFERLCYFAEEDLIPVVPQKGSLGASGDLAPLAHLSLPLIGKGKFWNSKFNDHIRAKKVLKELKLQPVGLGAKDGLALCNGTQLMAAYGCYVIIAALRLIKYADVIAAMSLEALQGSLNPFDDRIHQVRPHPGQISVAQNVRQLLANSEIHESHRNCGKVQDPYSLRCVPQVHGATRDAIEYARKVLEIEVNSVTDNPLVFENEDIISGGNFHGQPLAFALDFAAIALAELANISERRIYLLLEGHDGLPTLLMKDTGINSGYMITQYTAAALVSQNKALCHPNSVDSIPSCLGQEDHVSMGSLSALKLLEVLKNVEMVLSIELITAAQALDFRLPLKGGKGVVAAHEYVRREVPHHEGDDFFKRDINRSIKLIRSSEMLSEIEKASGELL